MASSNKSVGKDLLAVCIPKKAMNSRLIHLADGSPALFTLFSPPETTSRTFLYIPEGQDEGIEYGPNLVFGKSLLSGYIASSSDDRNKLKVSARIMHLEKGAKAGVLVLDHRRSGQFISLPKPEEAAEQGIIQTTIHEFMAAMANTDSKRAYDFFSNRAKIEVSLAKVNSLLQGDSGRLFVGYRRAEIKYVDISLQPTSASDYPQSVFASVYGTIAYETEPLVEFDALLERENDQWKLHSITIDVLVGIVPDRSMVENDQ